MTTKKELKEAQALARAYELARQGKTACVVCGSLINLTRGGKRRNKYCGLKCADVARRKRINMEAKFMGEDCYRVWLALKDDPEARQQYVEWVMFLGTTGWKYAHMFRHRWSSAREVVVQHYGEMGEGPKKLEEYLATRDVRQWIVPTASGGIAKKMADRMSWHSDEDTAWPVVLERLAEARKKRRSGQSH